MVSNVIHIEKDVRSRADTKLGFGTFLTLVEVIDSVKLCSIGHHELEGPHWFFVKESKRGGIQFIGYYCHKLEPQLSNGSVVMVKRAANNPVPEKLFL